MRQRTNCKGRYQPRDGSNPEVLRSSRSPYAALRQVLPQQHAVARNAVVATEHAQAGPQADRVVAQHRLADLLLEPLDDAHAAPVAARHDDRVGLRPVGAQAELVGVLRPDAAELDRGDDADNLAVHDVETMRPHERDHRLVHGPAPRRADRDALRAEPGERVDEGGRRRGGGAAGGVLHALNQLAVVALALGEGRRGRGEHDHVDLGVGELAALALELEHAAHLLLRRDVAVGDAPGVQRDVGGQRGEELRLLRRVGRRRQQAEAVAHCVPSRPAVLMTAWNFSVSALMKLANSSGLRLLAGFDPCLVIASLTSGMSSTFVSAVCSLAMIGFGTPAGASTPLQPTTTTPG